MKRSLAILILTLAASTTYAKHVTYTSTPKSTNYTIGIQNGCEVGRKFTLDIIDDGANARFQTSDMVKVAHASPSFWQPCTRGTGKGAYVCDWSMPPMHPGDHTVTIHINVYPVGITGYTRIGACNYSMAYGDTLSIFQRQSEDADRAYFKAHPRKPQPEKKDFTKW